MTQIKLGMLVAWATPWLFLYYTFTNIQLTPLNLIIAFVPFVIGMVLVVTARA